MNRTSITCPSCNRYICLALRPPLCSSLEECDISMPMGSKDYSIQDLLYVHEELIRENKHLRARLDDLYERFYKQWHPQIPVERDK